MFLFALKQSNLIIFKEGRGRGIFFITDLYFIPSSPCAARYKGALFIVKLLPSCTELYCKFSLRQQEIVIKDYTLYGLL